MTGSLVTRYASWLTAHSKLVLVVVLFATALVAAGGFLTETEEGDLGSFEVDSPEFEAADFVRANYGGNSTVTAQIVVRNEGGNVLTRESLIDGLELQLAALENEEISDTVAGRGFVGFENLVGTAAVVEDARTAGEQPPDSPSLQAQRDALAARSQAEVQALVATLLDREADSGLPADADPYQFLPRDFDPATASAEARLTLLTQQDTSGETGEPTDAYAAQVLVDKRVEERFEDAFVFGQGINDQASSNATGDSFAIITPFALLLILFVLGVTYRDVVDILLAIAGIIVVMLWLQGIMGWLQIPMNVILIAVPFLLIGLSIDYAVHVVMRYREARLGLLGVPEVTGGRRSEVSQEHGSGAGDSQDDAGDQDVGKQSETAESPAPRGEQPETAESPAAIEEQTETAQSAGSDAVRAGMAIGMGSVVLALAAATISTGVGFLSNVSSPLPAIQDFAILSGGGIFATFIAFCVFLPALKIEVDALLEGRLGRSRAKPAFGASPGPANRLLTRFATLTARVPFVIIVVAVLLTVAGAYGATTIDTEFNQADFLPEDPPAWTEYLPGPFQPGEYTIAEDFAYLNENFAAGGGQGGQASILIRGNVTDPAFLSTLDRETQTLEDDGIIQFRSDGSPAIEGPHTAIRTVAAENETFATAVAATDQTGNGLPDENLHEIYAHLFAADENRASDVLSRDGGEITSARLLVSVRTTESSQTIAASVDGLARSIEAGESNVTAVPTGEVVTTAVLQDALLETLVRAFAVTILVIFVFLTALFWWRYRAPSQGVIVVLPVVMALSWLFGVMALLNIPFNSETAVITSLAIGLGVDYSIHAGERFMAERDRTESVSEAIDATVTGTGGALLASAATTAAGFGVLALALSPPLRRFGTVTGAAIIFAFVAVVTLLPSLLIVRERLMDRFGGD